MGLFFGYVASLVVTFTLAASILTAITGFAGLNAHPKVEYVSSQGKPSNKRVSKSNRDHRLVARGTKNKSTAVTADAAL
jgi:hypothetical protein